jgi:hypothetical protein
MATLGLLAAAVDPSVAAEGARAALVHLTQVVPSTVENLAYV